MDAVADGPGAGVFDEPVLEVNMEKPGREYLPGFFAVFWAKCKVGFGMLEMRGGIP